MSALDLNLRHLRALAETVRCSSVSEAAERVNLSQPAVTQALVKLEKAVSMQLLERRSTGVTATAGGLLLAVRVEAATAALARGFLSIRKSPGGFSRPDKLVTMTQVRGLLALAAEGSYVGAAQATHISQPALHRAVSDLERLCRVKLAERRGRGVIPTTAGSRLVRAFRIAIKELDSGLEELAFLTGKGAGYIRVGAMPLARARLLPLAAAAFFAKHPTVTVEICEGSHNELIERLRDGRLDLLVGAMRTPSPGPDIHQSPLFEDELIIVGRKGHQLAKRVYPELTRLAGYPWVIGRPGTPLRGQWESMFAKENVEPPAAPLVCGSVMAIRTLLMESDFLTLLSPDQVRLELQAGVLVQIGEPLEATRRQIGLTARSDWHPTKAQAEFVETLKLISSRSTLKENEYQRQCSDWRGKASTS